ncbi:hypothetical protein K1T71_007018 [Dendrolimus kikuchii]|uniref:Uncharacterized protein n=1 Tax=Dendrolimus kikuchii TaxID=765133 RepID=A0ACC1CZW9_9NEOP|nr:hypothetical protein K1T71_007018 [Dendrolimus kikuchii]
MKMKGLVCFIFAWLICIVTTEIRDSAILNKLIKVKPVGGSIAKNFIPLTELPAPRTPHYHKDGRRHFEEECSQRPSGKNVYEGAKVDLFGEYYDDGVAKTVATVIIPDHIDRKHFEVTSQVPYLTVGPIEGIGYHPTTDNPNECEKIYQDHLSELYSEEPTDNSEESLEMARMPLFPPDMPVDVEDRIEKMYSDLDM